MAKPRTTILSAPKAGLEYRFLHHHCPLFFSGPHNEFEETETCGICNKPIKRDETVVTGPCVDGRQ